MDRKIKSGVATNRLRVGGLILALVLALALILMWAAATALAQGPEGEGVTAAATVGLKISYQGKLTDSGGSPVSAATSVTFSLYNVSSGGTALWTETKTISPTNEGLFTAQLGDTTAFPAFPANLFNGQALWLGVQVGSDAEMTPRQEVLPVPYAAGLRPGTLISGTMSGTAVLRVDNYGTGTGVTGYAYQGWGVYGNNVDGTGVYGYSVYGKGGKFISISGPTIIEAHSSTDREFYVDNVGNVYADGAYNCGLGGPPPGPPGSEPGTCIIQGIAADFAEMRLARNDPEPGDVLVIDADGQLLPATSPYASSVVGVYSTQPGYLGSGAKVGQEGYVPLAIVGIVPVKASAENGPIVPGDMLTTSSTAGHAMRAGDDPPQGTVVGKALGPLAEGTGVIEMLVMLQ